MIQNYDIAIIKKLSYVPLSIHMETSLTARNQFNPPGASSITFAMREGIPNRFISNLFKNPESLSLETSPSAF